MCVCQACLRILSHSHQWRVEDQVASLKQAWSRTEYPSSPGIALVKLYLLAGYLQISMFTEGAEGARTDTGFKVGRLFLEPGIVDSGTGIRAEQ